MIDRRTFVMGAAALTAACATTTTTARSFSSDRISVTTRGSGRDVVLIPGLTSSPEIWESTVAAVPGYRYHLVQVLGFAGTPVGGNAGEGPILATLAEEIARYIGETRLERPALVGHSMGGSIAMMVAARHPALISRVMIVDMLPFMGMMFGPPGTTAESVRPTADMVAAGILARTPEQRRASIETNIAQMVRTEALRAGPIGHGIASDLNLGARAMRDLIVTDLRPELPSIRVPMRVLYVRGPNIPLTDDQMDAIYKLSFAGAPQATLRRIPDSYHFIMYDQPEIFASELRSFLASG